uniref:Uncharacterized protein n=1 Tax=Anguilla anguilla TaxID=7936 RepID=A0A0E9SWW1_ANGAN
MYFHIHFILALQVFNQRYLAKEKYFTPSQLNNITK